jgi:hypothetical protein
VKRNKDPRDASSGSSSQPTKETGKAHSGKLVLVDGHALMYRA